MKPTTKGKNTKGKKETASTRRREAAIARYARAQVAVEVATFDFYGDAIEAAKTPDGQWWAILDSLCAPFELKDTYEQARKLNGYAWASTVIITVERPSVGKRTVFCVNLRSIAGWLFTLNPGKVAWHLQERLALYQREAAEKLHDHFFGKRGVVPAGYLSPEQHAAQLEPERRRVAQLTDERDVLRADNLALREDNKALRNGSRSCVSPEEATKIDFLVRSVALLWEAAGRSKSTRSAARSIRNTAFVGWNGKGCRTGNMPREMGPHVIRELENMLTDAKTALGSTPRSAARRAADILAGQTDMFDAFRHRPAHQRPN